MNDFEDVDTPSLLLDLDAVERNLDRMTELLAGSNVKLRPHAKTHKIPQIAKMQLERGAVGVCCAKLGEAEALVDGGVSNILITTEIVGALKLRRLTELARRARLAIVVDDLEAAARVSEAAVAAGIRLSTLIDVDVGQHRTGVGAGDPAVRLGRAARGLPGLELLGLQGYEGHIQHIVDAGERRAANGRAMVLLRDTAARYEADGLPTTIVTTGGSGSGVFAAAHPGITDVQPGSYVVMDVQYGGVQGLDFENALTLLATVISVRDGTAIVDAGHKSLSSDAGMPCVIGQRADFTIVGDEHGKLTFSGERTVRIGEKVRLIPSHCDTTVNLHDAYAVHRSGSLIDRWPIVARGRSA